MEIVNIEARTFEAMLSAFRTFADRLDTLCRLYGDMEEKKWLDNQEVCLLLKVSPRTLQTLRDNGTLAYTLNLPQDLLQAWDVGKYHPDSGRAPEAG